MQEIGKELGFVRDRHYGPKVEALSVIWPSRLDEKGAGIECRINITGDLARKLIQIADRLKQKPVALLSKAIVKMIEDDIMQAVIDDG